MARPAWTVWSQRVPNSEMSPPSKRALSGTLAICKLCFEILFVPAPWSITHHPTSRRPPTTYAIVPLTICPISHKPSVTPTADWSRRGDPNEYPVERVESDNGCEGTAGVPACHCCHCVPVPLSAPSSNLSISATSVSSPSVTAHENPPPRLL